MPLRAEDLASLQARTWRAAARARRPDLVVRIVVAAARRAFPDSRVDVLIREPKRRWVTRALAPRGEPLTHARSTAEGRGRPRPSPQPPAATVSRDLRDGLEHVGDDELLRMGLVHRLSAPMRMPEARGVLSIARQGPAFESIDAELATELAAVLAPALAAEARLSRALGAVDRARFAQHVTAHVNRSLDAEDVLRSLAFRLCPRVQAERIDLSLVAESGRVGPSLTVDCSADIGPVRQVALDVGADPAFARVLETREPSRQDDLAALESPSAAERALLEHGLRSRVLVPLVARRRVVAVLGLAAATPGSLSGDSLSFVRHVARPLAVALDNARLLREARRRSRRMTGLYEVGQALGSAENVEDVTERVLWILHDTFAFQHSAVLRLEQREDGDWLVMQASRGYSRREAGSFRIRVGDRGITSRAVVTGQLVYVPDVRRDPSYVQGVEEGRSEIAVPLVAGGRVIGVLDIESTEVDAFTEEDLDTVRLFSTQVSLALERARIFEEIRRQAMTDSLTGLLNQRYFQEKVARELTRSQRTERPFVLCLLDIDDFKLINDSYGHVKGNQAIVRLGDVLAGRIRSIDAAARFGGDEFAMILSETNAESAMTVVHEVQEELRRDWLPGAGGIHVSVGVAEWHPAFTSVRDIVAAADAALYEAKRTGKDRACVAAPPHALGAERGAG